MKKLTGVLSFLFFLTNYVRSQQVDCANIGFETGTTMGWILSNGTVTAPNQVQ
jgi:hypothetical protein